MTDWERLQGALAYAARSQGTNLQLRELAARIGRSPYHAHRLLRAALGETPKQFTLRLRVDRAAAALLTTRDSILEIALACGFESHEAFCRAFRRRYRMSPSVYRKRGLHGAGARRHADLVAQIGPCVGLYRMEGKDREPTMAYEVSRRDLAAQTVLVVRRRVPRSGIAAAIGEELGKIFLCAQQRGLALSGHPFTRYLETSVAMMTMEIGMAVAAHPSEAAPGDILLETLPAGPAAVTLHSGLYERLPDAYAALEQWILSHGFKASGAPWEVYLTDPADYPNPQDWRTEVCQPLAS